MRQPAAEISACCAAFRLPTNANSDAPAVSSGATPPVPFAVALEGRASHSANSRTRMPHHIAAGAVVSYEFIPSIHPSWSPHRPVHPDAAIGPGVVIGDFCVVESDVQIGAGCLLEPYVYVKRWTTMGERNEISAGTSSAPTRWKELHRTRSYLRIGNGNKIREHFTISRGTPPSPPPKSATTTSS